ncbi:MAG: LysR family transcriptional regulator [Clostridiales bacterium]|nr:LysR family transcriptional regulator [Clostridiales bacterium]
MQEIKCFLTLAECLNFTETANRLYISQPGVSKMISSLEEDLEVKLFTRSTRSVRLTRAGEHFLTIAKEFVRQCETLKAYHPKTNSSLSCTLTIGIADISENRRLVQIINNFIKSHPLCNLSLREYNPEELLREVDANVVDFGAIITYAIPPTGYEYYVYDPSPLMLVVPPTHRFADRKKVSISELKDENFLCVFRNSSRAVNRIQEICAKGNFRPKFVKETNSLSTVFMLIATGMGVGIHFLLHKDSCSYDLRFIDLDLGEGEEQELTDGAALIWNKNNPNPAIPHFLDCVYKFNELNPPNQRIDIAIP